MDWKSWWQRRWTRRLLAIAALAAALTIGFAIGRSAAPGPEHGHVQEPVTTAAGDTVWTCSMHPQVRLPEPGRCPICFMDLIPVEGSGADADEEGPRELVFSETARRLARIRTAPVVQRFPVVEVRMVGKVDYDETRVSYITSYVGGRLERLYVDYTGARVERNDHLVDIYSPELIAAQEELLQAIAAQRRLRASGLEVMRRTAVATVAAAREKLRLLGLLPQQIAEVERHGMSSDTITLYSPMAGVVIEKHAQQGMYVDTGTRIYTIADLDRVWVRLQAYESDIEWVHHGQEVTFTTEAYPGEEFRGRVSFIDPVVDPRTRTVKLRVNVDNRHGRLKPEMLVSARASAQLADADRVFDPDLADKWISPMHPWIIKDGPGTCDVCGMELVPAAELGFVPRGERAVAPLVVPHTAPLITGERAVVYVEHWRDGRPRYEGREVVLGTRAGDLYVVEAGLVEGERVVVEGAFKIDASLQIRAKPSMMNPSGGAAPAGHQHGAEPGSRTPEVGAQTRPQTRPAAGPQTQPQTRPQSRPATGEHDHGSR